MLTYQDIHTARHHDVVSVEDVVEWAIDPPRLRVLATVHCAHDCLPT